MPEMVSVNPFTEEVNGRFPLVTYHECLVAADEARQAFDRGNSSPWRIGSAVAGIAGRLRATRAHCAEIIVREMGKTIRQALGEVDKCACSVIIMPSTRSACCTTNPCRPSREQLCELRAARGHSRDHALEFPVLAGFSVRSAVLAAGNTCLLKHASNVPLCALEIERVVPRGGLCPASVPDLARRFGHCRRLIEADAVDGYR